MGRKQKLKEEKRRNKKNNPPPTVSSSKATALSTATTEADDLLRQKDKQRTIALNEEFPKSDMYEERRQRNMSMNGPLTIGESIKLCEQAAIECACVHSMIRLAYDYSQVLGGNYVLQAQSWHLEVAIRGNSYGMKMLIQNYKKINHHLLSCGALISYWGKQVDKMSEIKQGLKTIFKKSIGRVCVVCKRRDTEAITLQQCMGCSMYCYCSEICQTAHHHHHRGDCKQLQILNKYHKPCMKEIRNASISGDIEIPALEKLRYKLGLTRPAEDYEELKNGYYEGEPIADPYDFVIARKDGTVWVGSNPRSPLGQSSSSSADTTTTTTIESLLVENNQQKPLSSFDTTAAESVLEEKDHQKEE